MKWSMSERHFSDSFGRVCKHLLGFWCLICYFSLQDILLNVFTMKEWTLIILMLSLIQWLLYNVALSFRVWLERQWASIIVIYCLVLSLFWWFMTSTPTVKISSKVLVCQYKTEPRHSIICLLSVIIRTEINQRNIILI